MWWRNSASSPAAPWRRHRSSASSSWCWVSKRCRTLARLSRRWSPPRPDVAEIPPFLTGASDPSHAPAMSNRWRRQNAAIPRSRPALVMPLLVAGAWLLGTAAALAAPDCPPMGHLPNYIAAQEPEREEFDGIDFTIKKDDDAETLTVLGRTCTQRYMLTGGARALGDGEIQSTYRSQLGKLGAEILFAEDRSTSARIRQGGQETWIAVWSQGSEIDIVVVEKQPFKATLAAPAGNDYRLLGHMPNYVSAAPEKASSAQLGFMVQDGDDTYGVMAEGARYAVT